MVQLSHPYMTTGKTIALTIQIFLSKVMSLLFNILSRFVITSVPRSKCLLISWLQSLFTVILEPNKIIFPHLIFNKFLFISFLFIEILSRKCIIYNEIEKLAHFVRGNNTQGTLSPSVFRLRRLREKAGHIPLPILSLYK